MNFKLKLLSSVVVLGLLAGCSSKQDVVVGENNKQESMKNVDDKISQIKSNVESNEAIVETKIDGKDYNEVSSTIDNETIVMKSIHFRFDVFTLSEEKQEISVENAKKIDNLSKTNNTFKVKVEGNCDEWGTDEYNYALGLKRANTVKKDLIRNGISSDRIITVSYGESNPVCGDQTAKCWNLNRRVDYRLLP
jgi:peptidoglycan-associated lipoprotein